MEWRERVRSGGSRRLVAQDEQLRPPHRDQRNGAALRIQKLRLEGFRRMDFHDRTDLSACQTILGPLLKKRDHIEEFDRPVLHVRFVSRSNSPSEGNHCWSGQSRRSAAGPSAAQMKW